MRRVLFATAIFALLISYLVWKGSDQGIAGKHLMEVAIVGLIAALFLMFIEVAVASRRRRKKDDD